jgi:FkbM family methyltransferase
MHILTKLLRVLWIPQYRWTFLRTRVAASTEHDAVLGGLEVDSVIDIGANRGQFALCCRRLFPDAPIVSFEPLQAPANTYRRVFAGDTHTRLVESAIGTTAGTAAMHVSRWDVSSSLLPIGQGQHDNFPLTEEARQETVTVSPLSAHVSSDSLGMRALLKLDVQGFELAALQGCADLLDRFQYVYVEASFIELYVGQALATEVIAWLLERNFQLRCVANLSYGKSQRPIQADFLFVR